MCWVNDKLIAVHPIAGFFPFLLAEDHLNPRAGLILGRFGRMDVVLAAINHFANNMDAVIQFNNAYLTGREFSITHSRVTHYFQLE